LLERIESEALGLGSPCLAEELVGGETFEGLQPAAEIVGRDEVGKMPMQLVVIAVVEND
jgi:hypothetical protein